MIKSFACKDTKKLFNNLYVKNFASFQRQAQIKLKLLNAINDVNELTIPPGNRLEALKGNRSGQYSIRINKQWRICFTWKDSHVYDVEIVDYH
ncbi:MAG: type II toxin-antitoxin system RelE/ParE family toxin [Rickettsiaceae bacterium]|nr:type II toxin-antitoxin system RelE/ParE family toxin [Rickettsiaceae bacterium]